MVEKKLKKMTNMHWLLVSQFVKETQNIVPKVVFVVPGQIIDVSLIESD